MATLSYEDTSKLILQSRGKANLLVDLLEKIDSTCKDEVIEVISSLETVFKGFFSQRIWHETEIRLDSASGEGTELLVGTGVLGGTESKKDIEKADSGRNAERIYASWAHKQYLAFVKDLLRLCNHKDRTIQKSALDCLMRFLVSDYRAMISSAKCNPKKGYFPTSLFSSIIECIFSSESKILKSQLKYFEQRYLGFVDIQFYTIRTIYRILAGKSKSFTMDEDVKSTVFAFLLQISEKSEKDESLKGFVIDDIERLQKINKDSKERKNLLSNTWLSVLQMNLSSQNLRWILVNLHEKIMPQIEDPKLLIDFLTDCYNLEGSIALLALNGLFLLIQNYNLDYPDFFKKLYNLLDADTFGAQYRDRFLALTDLFLTSMNLPGYMAAAFIKRLARISLKVSADGIRVILVMIENLMKRHPSCRVLIHRKVNTQFSTREQASVDPYNYEQSDPALCNALSSSLWELKTLEQHYSSEIQEAVKVFNEPFGRQEKDLNLYLESSYADVFDRELTAFENDESVVLNFDTPRELFNTTLYEKEFWSLE